MKAGYIVEESMKVIILGATGMLGHAVFRLLSEQNHLDVWGTIRNRSVARIFDSSQQAKLIAHMDVLQQDCLIELFRKHKPDVVINCVGLIKQFDSASDALAVLPVNAMLPHRLSRMCETVGARLVHISTDCVFSGSKGAYTETDLSDACDLYGKSKFIGEVVDSANSITLRTSIIGHELSSQVSLIDWFLAQQGSVKGYTKAIFSGLPTVELARVIRDHVLTEPQLSGLYHVSVDPIDKCSLLKLVAEAYGKDIKIIEDAQVQIDRSLNSSKFRSATGYQPPSWKSLIELMRDFK
jgi:dTDP-4-dehydrorhamnose reductase